MINIHPLGTLLCGHVEYWRSLARIIDDDVVDVIVIDDVGDERLLLTTRCALRAKMLLLVMGVITTLIWRGCQERRLADVSRPWMCPPINLSCQLWRWLVLLWLGIVVLILLKDLTWGQ